MPLQDHMRLASVDDHLIEPPHVWSERLPRKYLEDGPTLVEAGGDQPMRDHVVPAVIQPGSQAWRYEGRYDPQIGLNAVAGKPRESYASTRCATTT